MVAYKAPDFNQRAAAARAAKQRALELLRDKPEPDAAAIAARRPRAKPRKPPRPNAAPQAAPRPSKPRPTRRRRLRRRSVEKAPPEKAVVVVPSAAELKAARDARYAARKARK